MRWTGAQRRVIDHGDGPARVIGGFATGKTTALQARAARLAGLVGADRVLVVCRSLTAGRRFGAGAGIGGGGVPGTTFWELALGIVARHHEPVRLLRPAEQRALVGELLAGEDPDFAAEVADMVCHFQASYLGDEELRTHADAAGVLPTWERLAAFTREYVAALDARGAVDWAGALVRAGLLLRDPDVLHAERGRFEHVLVDDYEAASFATHRLLSLLTGPGADVLVAGNPEAAIAGRFGGTSRYLLRFPQSFGAIADIRLHRRLQPPPSSVLVRGLASDSEAALVVDELRSAAAGAGAGGSAWSDMAVIVCQWGRDGNRILRALADAGIPSVAAEGPDPWDRAEPIPPGGCVSVGSIDATAGRHWPIVILTGCIEGSLPADMPSHRWFDRALLEGPDVPGPDERLAQWEAEERRRFEVARSRATRRLVLVSSPPEGGRPSRFVST